MKNNYYTWVLRIIVGDTAKAAEERVVLRSSAFLCLERTLTLKSMTSSYLSKRQVYLLRLMFGSVKVTFIREIKVALSKQLKTCS